MQYLLPEICAIIGNYAVRCEICFGHFLINGRCQNCPRKIVETDYITWQMIHENFDISSRFDLTSSQPADYDFTCKILGSVFIPNETVRQGSIFQMNCFGSFIVYQIKIDPKNKNRMWLLLSDCVDHLECKRQIWQHLGVFIQRKKWRMLSNDEIGIIFGDVFDWTWSQYRFDTVAFDAFRLAMA